MANIPYSELLRDPRWQRKRLEILSRDNWACTKCGNNAAELNVHHHHYRKGKKPWEYDGCELATLCRPCHEGHHVSEKTRYALYPGGQISDPALYIFDDSWPIYLDDGGEVEVPFGQKFKLLTAARCRRGYPRSSRDFGDKGVFFRIRLIGGSLDGLEGEHLNQGQWFGHADGSPSRRD